MDKDLLTIQLEMQMLISEREGMKAENAQREALGMSVAYSAAAFSKNMEGFSALIDKLHGIERKR